MYRHTRAYHTYICTSIHMFTRASLFHQSQLRYQLQYHTTFPTEIVTPPLYICTYIRKSIYTIHPLRRSPVQAHTHTHKHIHKYILYMSINGRSLLRVLTHTHTHTQIYTTYEHKCSIAAHHIYIHTNTHTHTYTNLYYI